MSCDERRGIFLRNAVNKSASEAQAHPHLPLKVLVRRHSPGADPEVERRETNHDEPHDRGKNKEADDGGELVGKVLEDYEIRRLHGLLGFDV